MTTRESKLAKVKSLIEYSKQLDTAMNMLNDKFKSLNASSPSSESLHDMQSITAALKVLVSEAKTANDEARVLVEEVKTDDMIKLFVDHSL